MQEMCMIMIDVRASFDNQLPLSDTYQLIISNIIIVHGATHMSGFYLLGEAGGKLPPQQPSFPPPPQMFCQ